MSCKMPLKNDPIRKRLVAFLKKIMTEQNDSVYEIISAIYSMELAEHLEDETGMFFIERDGEMYFKYCASRNLGNLNDFDNEELAERITEINENYEDDVNKILLGK